MLRQVEGVRRLLFDVKEFADQVEQLKTKVDELREYL
jgi:hypothetical protein